MNQINAKKLKELDKKNIINEEGKSMKLKSRKSMLVSIKIITKNLL